MSVGAEPAALGSRQTTGGVRLGHYPGGTCHSALAETDHAVPYLSCQSRQAASGSMEQPSTSIIRDDSSCSACCLFLTDGSQKSGMAFVR